MKNFYKYFFTYIYVFIIFSAMLPTRENSNSFKNLEPIIPGINSIYNDEETEKLDKKYTFKILEIFKKIK